MEINKGKDSETYVVKAFCRPPETQRIKPIPRIEVVNPKRRTISKAIRLIHCHIDTDRTFRSTETLQLDTIVPVLQRVEARVHPKTCWLLVFWGTLNNMGTLKSSVLISLEMVERPMVVFLENKISSSGSRSWHIIPPPKGHPLPAQRGRSVHPEIPFVTAATTTRTSPPWYHFNLHTGMDRGPGSELNWGFSAKPVGGGTAFRRSSSTLLAFQVPTKRRLSAAFGPPTSLLLDIHTYDQRWKKEVHIVQRWTKEGNKCPKKASLSIRDSCPFSVSWVFPPNEKE